MTTQTGPAQGDLHETEEDGRYEVAAWSNGRLYGVIVWRDPVSGWPYDYKVKAHAQIRQAMMKDPHP